MLVGIFFSICFHIPYQSHHHRFQLYAIVLAENDFDVQATIEAIVGIDKVTDTNNKPSASPSVAPTRGASSSTTVMTKKVQHERRFPLFRYYTECPSVLKGESCWYLPLMPSPTDMSTER
jgi:hypothetical protein